MSTPSAPTKLFIHVGQVAVGASGEEISTVLGSCVGVCLWDPIRVVGGMNHYLLPLWNDNGLATPKFGNIAIPKLLEAMERAGAQRANIQAKVFGGANINFTVSDELMVGKRNIMVAREVLSRLGIPIVAEDVGGNAGRRILLKTDTGKVLMKTGAVPQEG